MSEDMRDTRERQTTGEEWREAEAHVTRLDFRMMPERHSAAKRPFGKGWDGGTGEDTADAENSDAPTPAAHMSSETLCMEYSLRPKSS